MNILALVNQALMACATQGQASPIQTGVMRNETKMPRRNADHTANRNAAPSRVVRGKGGRTGRRDHAPSVGARVEVVSPASHPAQDVPAKVVVRPQSATRDVHRFGRPEEQPRLTTAQQAEKDARDATYWAWVEARMQGRFGGTLAEFRAIQSPPGLNENTYRQLRVIARERNIRGRSKMLKAALIEAIKIAGLPDEPGPLLKVMMDGVQ